MRADQPDPPPFHRLGPATAGSPVVLAVTHAGRCYPPALMAAARLPRHALETIEDRYADLLVADAVADGAVAIVATMARAFVDLNRDEREVDAAMLDSASRTDLLRSPKVAGGLGVIPSRIAAGGAVWRRRFSPQEVEERIARAHRPVHAAIAKAMDAAQAVHGFALLIDCHSMPSLGRGGARVVIGDRHGSSAARHLARAAQVEAVRHGLRCACNHPYPGGYTLQRHGAPRKGRHAIQIEVDRGLYLNATQQQPGDGLFRTRALIAGLASALVAAFGGELAQAAE